MTETHAVTLEAFAPERHRPLLERWLRSPHVVRWWGAQEEFLRTVERRASEAHALIAADGRPVGYVCWQHPSREELEAAKLTDLPENVVDIDIMIGEPVYIGCGIGPKALTLLLARLASEGVENAGLATSVSNRSAIRAFEKAGFGLFRDFEDPDGQYRYMVTKLRPAVAHPVTADDAERPPSDPPL
jgi:RimJ/RimL family protein N-acetyltransferase